MSSLVLKNINKSFDTSIALTDISFEVEGGEFAVLVGPSGCGKSTILRIIAGLEPPTSGDIILGNTRINQTAPKDRDIAMVFQNYALYPHMTVFNNIGFSLKMRKMKKSEIHHRVIKAANTLKLTELLSRKPAELSGGQQQRVALGRAIVRNPKIFLLDEPLSNLDAKLRITMRAELIKLHKKLKTTFLYVTHDQVEAMSMGQRLIVLNEGKVQQIGAPLDIYTNPVNRFVADFIGSPPMNFFTCIKNSKNEEVFLQHENISRIDLPQDKQKTLATSTQDNHPVVLGIRPEHITETPKPPGGAAILKVPAFVEFLEPLGSEIIATCKIGNNNFFCRLQPDTEINADQYTTLFFDMRYAKLFNPENGAALS